MVRSRGGLCSAVADDGILYRIRIRIMFKLRILTIYTFTHVCSTFLSLINVFNYRLFVCCKGRKASVSEAGPEVLQVEPAQCSHDSRSWLTMDSLGSAQISPGSWSSTSSVGAANTPAQSFQVPSAEKKKLVSRILIPITFLVDTCNLNCS